MENKKDRLLLESEVIAAVDKHTNSYNRLDNDITCILEEVKEKAVVVTMKTEDYKGGDGSYVLSVSPKEEVKKNNDIFKKVKDLLDEFEEIYENPNEIPDEDLFFKLAHAFYKTEKFNLYRFYSWLRFFINDELPLNEMDDVVEFLKEKYGVEE